LLRFHASLHPESATAIHTVLLDEGDAAVRAVAIQILGSIDPEGWEDRFAADYPFVEAAEQEAIASTLAAHLPAERAARLLQELHDVVPAKPLVNAWSHLGSRDSGIILDRFTREPDPHARKEMLTGFFSDTVGPEEAVRFFSAVIDGEVDRGVVTQAILMLGTVDHDEARALIARNIDDPRWRDGIGDALFNSIPSAPDRFLRERVIPWYRAHILGTPLATAGRCERWRRAVALRAPELLGEMEP
ncbi:MAG: hypothetical protein ACE5GW_13935, partial [Planctomycetota bacterium]